MDFVNVIEGKNILKKYKGFQLEIPEFHIPKGCAIALVGENGAGKTTLLNILAGIQLDCQGQLTYFGQYSEKDREDGPEVKNRIGYVGPGSYYFPQWTIKNIEELYGLLFDDFSLEEFRTICGQLAIFPDGKIEEKKKNSALSDGNKMKLMLAGAFARKPDLLLLDEPASPLDPLMRDLLCQMIRNYLDEGKGERTALYSTHDIADMESITDYCMIVEHGQLVEAGYADELKEKYKEPEGTLPTLSQVCIRVMRENTRLGFR